MEIKPIAKIYTDFPDKFGLPRQSMIIKDLKGKIIFEPEYRIDEALRGLDGFSHIWLIWEFSKRFASLKDSSDENTFSPTVRPPRLGGNKRMGVFATRSPNRPNPLALSCVKIEEIRKEPNAGTVIVVSGIDMADGTPIYDIKPYISLSDSVPDALCGFTSETGDTDITVSYTEEITKSYSAEYLSVLTSVLKQDPRPHYKCGETKEYSFSFRDEEITFTAEDNNFMITDIKKR